MQKTIWIVNYYTSSPELNTHPRYIKFARYFQKMGYDVITFNASIVHGTNIDLVPQGEKYVEKVYEDLKFVHINVPKYKGNGIKRMYSIFSFAMRLYALRNHFEKPDLVLHNIHTPFDYPVVWVAKSFGAKYIGEAWDLWPEGFAKFGLVSYSNPILKLFYQIERKLYTKADSLIFTLPGIPYYIKKKGWDKESGGTVDMAKVHYINNGIDIEEFDKNRELHPREDSDMNDPCIRKIVYLGSIRLANNVKTLIDTAALMKSDNTCKFFIYGDGVDRPYLEDYVKKNNITNVVFKEKRISYAECAWVVSQATINIMNYEKGFGYMGLSAGKLFQYLAAGRPIVCNISIDYDDVINDNQLGVCKEMSEPSEFASAINEILNLSQDDYNSMCTRVRKCSERFDYKVLAPQELSVIESLL